MTTQKSDSVSFFERRGAKALIVLGTFLVAATVAWIIFTKGDLRLLIFAYVGFVLFPGGIVHLLPENLRMPFSEIIGWVVYFCLGTGIVLTPKKLLVGSLYIIFVVLLLINMVGCQRMTIGLL